MMSAWESATRIGQSRATRTLYAVEELATRLREQAIARGDTEHKANVFAMHARCTGTTAGAWYRCGMPRISIGHRHAAALMATNVPAEVAVGLRPPWSGFGIIVPPKLIWAGGSTDGTFEVAAMLIAHDGTNVMLTLYDDVVGPRTSTMVDSIERLGELAHVDRGFEMMARLAIGVMFEMNEKRPAGSFTSDDKAPQKISHRGVIIPSTFALTRDVKIDAREAVRDYVRHGGMAPTVRSLVRGHWRRHIVSRDSAERRWSFVEPYWKGALDAPLALRDHVLVGP